MTIKKIKNLKKKQLNLMGVDSMEIKPVRITRSRQHKQVSPNGLPIVYVGRGSKWGNPYKATDYNLIECITRYEFYIGAFLDEERLYKDLAELRGKNLSCWCKQDAPCHADLLLDYANNYILVQEKNNNGGTYTAWRKIHNINEPSVYDKYKGFYENKN
jgi:hypothetical protein